MEYASKALWVTETIKKRVLSIREHPRDTHNMVIIKLVDFWEENHKEDETDVEKESTN